MNERTLELAQQAGLKKDHASDREYLGDFDWREFAELIVRECADQIVSQGKDWIDFAPSQIGSRPEYWKMAQHIKQHFGVKNDIT